jgi:DNA-nicking Smr family endonuclease
MVRKRSLTPEEKRLWKYITRNDLPLKEKPDEPEEIVGESEIAALQKPAVKLKEPDKAVAGAGITFANKKKHQEKELGDYAGIDLNTAERFRKGNAPIDARLDLHGMTSEKAHHALIGFIERQAKLEKRRLLVITGKGSGILRDSLPRWLSAPAINKLILAFDVAQQKHGGAGAYYILLKRRRKNKKENN